MTRRPRPPHEFESQLATQLRLLERSADHFDEGDEGEAQRLAHSLRILVHSNRNQTSLLKHLRRDDQSFWDTRFGEPESGRPYCGLATVTVSASNDRQRYSCLLSGAPEPALVPFAQWWSAPVVSDGGAVSLTRAALILALAEQDGGSHVDAGLDEAYSQVTRADALGWNPLQLPSGVDRSAAFACVRQIAHEALMTLRPGYEKRLGNDSQEFQVWSAPKGAQLNVLKWDPPTASNRGGSGVEMEIKFAIDKRTIPRLAPCPCGSKKRFKACHGMPGAGPVFSIQSLSLKS